MFVGSLQKCYFVAVTGAVGYLVYHLPHREEEPALPKAVHAVSMGDPGDCHFPPKLHLSPDLSQLQLPSHCLLMSQALVLALLTRLTWDQMRKVLLKS